MLPCVFDEVFNNNVEAGPDTDEAVAWTFSTNYSAPQSSSSYNTVDGSSSTILELAGAAVRVRRSS